MTWIATVDTPQGVVVGDNATDMLLAFSDALDDVRGATGAATSINTATGVLSATFNVEVVTVQEATDAAVEIFNAALDRVGLPTGNVVHLDVEPLEDRELVLA